MILTKEKLLQIIPLSKDSGLDVNIINRQMAAYGINTPLRVAHFIAQLAHESGSFKYTSENLNYSASALRSVFGKYFPVQEIANDYARKPQLIAGRVYADRMGNGDEKSNEGWKYRGRGYIQLTGKDNYTQLTKETGFDFINNPDELANNPKYAILAACWYWNSRQLNKYADQDNIREVTLRVNGGYNGLEDRSEFLNKAKSILL